MNPPTMFTPSWPAGWVIGGGADEGTNPPTPTGAYAFEIAAADGGDSGTIPAKPSGPRAARAAASASGDQLGEPAGSPGDSARGWGQNRFFSQRSQRTCAGSLCTA